MVTSMVGAFIYIPGNFDEVKLFEQFPIENHEFRDGFDLQDMFFIISRLIEVPYINSKHRGNDGFISLKAKYLQNIVPSYSDYLKYLVSANVISINKHYVPGTKSRSYAFCEPYISAPDLKEIPVSIASRLYKRIAKQHGELAVSDAVKQQYPHLAKWLNSNLTINFEEANQIIRLIHKLRQSEKAAVNKRILKRQFEMIQADEVEELTRKEREEYHRAVRPFYEYKFGLLTVRKQRWFAKIDDTVNRFHTNITNLKSELRYCLRYSGRDMVCVDIKNSQPYLSILLFHPGFYEDESRWIKLFNKNQKQRRIHSIPSTTHSLLPISLLTLPPTSLTLSSFPTIHQSLTNHSKYFQIFTILLSDNVADNSDCKAKNDKLSDLRDYINHAIKGTLYEHISDKMRERGYPVPELRKEIKAMVFQTLFTDNRFKGQEDARPKRLFAELFPTIAKIFDLIKTSKSELLPILLQQIESTLFLNRIAKRISVEKPNLPIYTIHDSIMTLKGEERYVENVIKDECTRLIGVAPEVSVEYYTDAGVQDEINKLQQKLNP